MTVLGSLLAMLAGLLRDLVLTRSRSAPPA